MLQFNANYEKNMWLNVRRLLRNRQRICYHSYIKFVKQEMKDTYIFDFTNRIKPRRVDETINVVDFEQYLREAKLYCEWMEIFASIEGNIRQQASQYLILQGK